MTTKHQYASGSIIKPTMLGLLLSLVLILQASAEVSNSVTGEKNIIRGTYRLQCWQNGVKIIDEVGKGDYSWTLPPDQKYFSFRREAEALPSTYLSSNGYTTCLIKKQDAQ
ncbi:MAG: hypothetical protein HQL43_04190 [Alphaproteobacteria bacterium]|nr:hypothetical protein [Alphaproteobacteria bacterium]